MSMNNLNLISISVHDNGIFLYQNQYKTVEYLILVQFEFMIQHIGFIIDILWLHLQYVLVSNKIWNNLYGSFGYNLNYRFQIGT